MISGLWLAGATFGSFAGFSMLGAVQFHLSAPNIVSVKALGGCAMKSSRSREVLRFQDQLIQSGRAALAGTLCALMATQPLFGEAPKPAPVVKLQEVQGQQRVLHALNRLTFGPRPGDVAAVQAMGLDKWFEQQLNPATISDAELDAKLVEYPAMNLPLVVLQRKFPGPQQIRAMLNGRGQMPTDPVMRAMVEDQKEFYKLQQKVQAANAANPSASSAGDMTASANSDMGMSPQAAPPAKPRTKAQQVKDGMNALDAEAGQPMTVGPQTTAPDVSMDPVTPAANVSGAMRDEARKLVEMAPADRFRAILALSPNQLQRLRPAAGPALTAGFTPEQKEILIALPGSVRMIALESMESRLMRDIYSERQLEAVMTDFWLNHFNVYVRKNQNEAYLLPSYERDTIRPNALGNFETLLVATAKSPAMLEYLDNFRSVGPDSLQATRIKRAKEMNPNAKALQQASAGLNENYGRELMELHTLGVNGGYTQADVTQVAKVFTGWGLDRPLQGSDYVFDERRHEPGSKIVLGKMIKESGEREGLEVLHMLATSPATAHFISTKLAVRFVSDVPPAALVDRMAASFLKSNGDIKTVLRTMFQSPEFWSTDAYRAKVKTPEEFVISAVRASGAEVNNPQPLVQALNKLGMPLYGMQTPNGYSWTQEGWVSTGALVSRMNFALVLSASRLPGVHISWADLVGDKSPMTPASYSPASATDPTLAKEKRLEEILLGQPVSDRTRITVIGQSTDTTVTEQAVTQFDLTPDRGSAALRYGPKGRRGLNGPASEPDDAQAAVMAGLLLGSPEFQRR